MTAPVNFSNCQIHCCARKLNAPRAKVRRTSKMTTHNSFLQNEFTCWIGSSIYPARQPRIDFLLPASNPPPQHHPIFPCPFARSPDQSLCRDTLRWPSVERDRTALAKID